MLLCFTENHLKAGTSNCNGGLAPPLFSLVMRFTQFWPTGCRWSENPDLTDLEERLASLSEKDRLLILQEVACLSEASYRRGFQQGHATGEKDSAWFRKPSQVEIATWRFNIPLEYAAPTPGYYKNEKEAEHVWRSSRLGDYTSLDRIAMEASGVSGFLERMLRSVTNRITKAQVQEVWGDGSNGTLEDED
jgi:hypothetical protein